jgi:hypothetical protein
LRRVIEAGIPLDGALTPAPAKPARAGDPDPPIMGSAKHSTCAILITGVPGKPGFGLLGWENGVELYRDRLESEWPRNSDGSLAMYTRSLDVRKLLAEAHEPHLARGQRTDEITTGPKDL